MKKIFVTFFLTITILTPLLFVSKMQKVEAVDDCTIVSAKWNPAGEQANDFYDDGTTGGDKTQGNIIVKSKNCVGLTDVNLTIYESDGLTSLTDDSWNDSGLDKRVLSIPSDNFTVNMELGEEDCETIAGGGINFDCDLYFALRKGNTTIYDSFNKSSGLLYYECDGVCQTNADLLMVIPNGSDDEPVNMDALNPTSTPNTYELLAPIGNLKFAPDNIGEYFNTIFLIAIGLCGALAVIMIVLGGIQYMGDESIFGKTEAKSKIMAAILGLLIALGSYALLNTINPDLLNGGVRIDQVSAAIEEEVIRMDVQEIKSTGGGNGTTKLCTDITTCKALCTSTNNGKDYTGTPPGVMSPSLAQNFDKIPSVEKNSGCLNCTAASNVILGLKKIKPAIDSLVAQGSIPNRNYSFKVVSVYRPAKDQIRVMCNSIYKNPGGLGEKYAYPALSNHGVGSAVDFYFYFDGKKVNNCKNTRTSGEIEKILDKAGFQRLNFEAWHFEYGGGKQTCKYPNCPEPKYCSL